MQFTKIDFRTTDEGEWFSTKYGGGQLGEGFAVYRGDASRACAYDSIQYLDYTGAERDSAAVAALFKTRASQRAALVAQYLPKQELARRVPQGLNAGRS